MSRHCRRTELDGRWVDKTRATRREGPRMGPSGSCSGTGRASCVQGLVIPRSSRPSASVSPSVDSLLSAQFHLGEIDRRLRGDARHTHSAHDARPQSSTCHLRPAQLVPNALLSHRTLDKAVPGVQAANSHCSRGRAPDSQQLQPPGSIDRWGTVLRAFSPQSKKATWTSLKS